MKNVQRVSGCMAVYKVVKRCSRLYNSVRGCTQSFKLYRVVQCCIWWHFIVKYCKIVFGWESGSTHIAWNSDNTVYSLLCTFVLEQVTSVYLLSTHFAMTCCTAMGASNLHSREQGPQSWARKHIQHTLCLDQLYYGVVLLSLHRRKEEPQSSVRTPIRQNSFRNKLGWAVLNLRLRQLAWSCPLKFNIWGAVFEIFLIFNFS